MGAISAFLTSLGTIKRNAILFGVALVVTAASFSASAVPTLFPESVASTVSLPLSVALMLMFPFFIGGLLSMAHEGLSGTTRLDTFVDGGTENYLPLVGAILLFSVSYVIIAIITLIAVVAAAILVLGVNVGGGATMAADSAGGLGLLFGLVIMLVMLLPTFFLQFYAPAIVVSNLGVGASFKRSAALVRRNFVSTLGYTIIATVIGLLVGSVSALLSLVQGTYSPAMEMESVAPEVGTSAVLTLFAVSVVLTTLVTTFGSVYQVAFYEDCLDTR